MRFAATLLAVVALLPGAGVATANGRFPAAVSVRFHPGDLRTLVVSATFGVLLSTDDGASFHWVCEDAMGYGGTYDPDLELTSAGLVLSTSFDGLRASRDGGCTWELVGGAIAGTFIADVEVAADGRVWAAASAATDNGVYVADGDDLGFARASLDHPGAFWLSLRTAPSDPDRVYLSGFAVSSAIAPGGGPSPLLYRSGDGGASFEPVLAAGLVLDAQPQPRIAAVSPVDPDVLVVRVRRAGAPEGDALYRSTDAGDSFAEVLAMDDRIATTFRAGGATVIAGSVRGAALSEDAGETWTPLVGAPRIACVGERADGAVFACGANFAPDFAALARSGDARAWAPVLTFEMIAGPLACPAGTIQHDVCAGDKWHDLTVQLGIETGDAGPTTDARTASDAAARADAGSGAGDDNGCTGCTVAALIPVVGWRRRCRRRADRDRAP